MKIKQYWTFINKIQGGIANYAFDTKQEVSDFIDKYTDRCEREMNKIIKITFSKDGDSYCYLIGENLQVGIAGFGKTKEEANEDLQEKCWEEAKNRQKRNHIEYLKGKKKELKTEFAGIEKKLKSESVAQA